MISTVRSLVAQIDRVMSLVNDEDLPKELIAIERQANQLLSCGTSFVLMP